jgi:hypothetical protein
MPQINVGGGFTIDLAEGERFVKVMKKHRRTLEVAFSDHMQGLFIKPPGHDDYSKAFAASGNDMIREFRDWVMGVLKDMQDKIDLVESQLKTYGQVESDNTMKA